VPGMKKVLPAIARREPSLIDWYLISALFYVESGGGAGRLNV